MSNGARYVVKTHWGVFSLDEGSYQDYLAGKHWISWSPGKKTIDEPSHSTVPPHTSPKALELRDEAEQHGVTQILSRIGKAEIARPPFSERFSNVSIEELNLTVRSSNGLMRAQMNTFGKLNELILSEHGITAVRNLGLKSAKEIHAIFFQECYQRLLPYERAQYWQEILDL